MHRARLLVLKAHPDLAHGARERILITSFLTGLADRQLAASLAVAKITSSSDAEKLAAEGESVRKEQRSRKAYMNYIPERPSCEDPEEDYDNDPEDADDPDSGDGEDDIAAAIGALTSFQACRSSSASDKSGERRKATAATKCFN